MMKPSDSTYTNSGSSMVGCFAVARARSLVPEVGMPARTDDTINAAWDKKNDLGSYVFPDDGD